MRLLIEVRLLFEGGSYYSIYGIYTLRVKLGDKYIVDDSSSEIIRKSEPVYVMNPWCLVASWDLFYSSTTPIAWL